MKIALSHSTHYALSLRAEAVTRQQRHYRRTHRRQTREARRQGCSLCSLHASVIAYAKTIYVALGGSK